MLTQAFITAELSVRVHLFVGCVFIISCHRLKCVSDHTMCNEAYLSRATELIN
jgi:hypothetical protein